MKLDGPASRHEPTRYIPGDLDPDWDGNGIINKGTMEEEEADARTRDRSAK